jgi:hypothetical protein
MSSIFKPIGASPYTHIYPSRGAGLKLVGAFVAGLICAALLFRQPADSDSFQAQTASSEAKPAASAMQKQAGAKAGNARDIVTEGIGSGTRRAATERASKRGTTAEPTAGASVETRAAKELAPAAQERPEGTTGEALPMPRPNPNAAAAAQPAEAAGVAATTNGAAIARPAERTGELPAPTLGATAPRQQAAAPSGAEATPAQGTGLPDNEAAVNADTQQRASAEDGASSADARPAKRSQSKRASRAPRTRILELPDGRRLMLYQNPDADDDLRWTYGGGPDRGGRRVYVTPVERDFAPPGFGPWRR